MHVPEKLDYIGKVILAPMVRMNSLPFRLLALEYGADIVYSEEIVDQKILACDRVINPVLGTVDYVSKIDQMIVFRTHPSEKSRVVFQLGTADPEMAAEVVKFVQDDVAGIDINMGCPKDYSVKGGMGAALLKKPDLADAILRKCREVCRISLTCKIRVLPKVEDAIAFAKRMEATGIDAIAVHGRTKEERPGHKNREPTIRLISESLTIPVIANGGSSEIRCHSDIEAFRHRTGTAAVMIARAVQSNPSLFCKEGPFSREAMISNCIKKLVDYEAYFTNGKYIIQQLYGDTSDEQGTRLLASLDLRDVCETFGMESYYDKIVAARGSGTSLKPRPTSDAGIKRDLATAGICEALDYTTLNKKLKKAHSTHTPKSRLLEYLMKHDIKSAEYDAVIDGKRYICSVRIDGKTYMSTVSHRTKKEAEQAASLVALRHLVPGFEM